LSIADGGEIEFLPLGNCCPVFILKMKDKNKKPNRKPPAQTEAQEQTAADCSTSSPTIGNTFVTCWHSCLSGFFIHLNVFIY